MILDVGRLSGTIADQQIAFGTAADIIGGDANLIYDTTTYPTPYLQMLDSALVIGNTGLALGNAPDLGWGIYVGNATYACSGFPCAPFQFNHELGDVAVTNDLYEFTGSVTATSADVTVYSPFFQVLTDYRGTKNYTSANGWHQPAGAMVILDGQPGSGTIDAMATLTLGISPVNGTITAHAGAHILSPNMNGGSIPTNYGLWIDDQTGSGITTAYAIKTGLGAVSFGDVVTVTGRTVATMPDVFMLMGA